MWLACNARKSDDGLKRRVEILVNIPETTLSFFLSFSSIIKSMKRLLGLLGVVCTLASTALGQGPGPMTWTDVNLTTRDYSGNVTATDRYHYPSPHPAVEKSPTSSVTHVVYVRGSTIEVDVTWKNDNDFALTGTLTWQEARLRGPGPNQNPAEQYITLSVSGSVSMSLAANGGTQTVPLTITGVPNYVAVGQLEIKYDLPLSRASGQTGNNGTLGNFHGWERIPLIDAAPVGLQETPWADLCEYSCRWAFGYSGTANVRRELTRGLHYSNRAPWNRASYSMSGAAYYPHLGNGSFGVFKLGLLLIALGDPWLTHGPEINYQVLVCSSFAATLHQAMASHGINADCRFYTRPNHAGYYTWPLCAAGTDSTVRGYYRSLGFDWHLVTRTAGFIFDSAASYFYECDTAGSTWMNPVWEWQSTLYWQNSTSLFGLAYGNLTCTPHWPVYDPANGYDWDISNRVAFTDVVVHDDRAPWELEED